MNDVGLIRKIRAAIRRRRERGMTFLAVYLRSFNAKKIYLDERA